MDAYSRSAEENKKITAAEVHAHFHRPPPPPKDVVPEAVSEFWVQMAERDQAARAAAAAASKKLPSDYERISRKMKGKGPIIKDAPSIGDFLADSRLSAEELALLTAGGDISKGAVVRQFELGKALVNPDKERNLTTQMRRLHQWYMEQSGQGFQAFPVRHTDDYFHNGDGSFWVYFKDLYELYNEDALDVSIVRTWTL